MTLTAILPLWGLSNGRETVSYLTWLTIGVWERPESVDLRV